MACGPMSAPPPGWRMFVQLESSGRVKALMTLDSPHDRAKRP